MGLWPTDGRGAETERESVFRVLYLPLRSSSSRVMKVWIVLMCTDTREAKSSETGVSTVYELGVPCIRANCSSERLRPRAIQYNAGAGVLRSFPGRGRSTRCSCSPEACPSSLRASRNRVLTLIRPDVLIDEVTRFFRLVEIHDKIEWTVPPNEILDEAGFLCAS